jgi:coenzyme F420-reducing hydrogenase beta subunit
MTARLNNNAAKELAGLVTCDLVCWGTASPPLFSQYLDWLGEKYGSHVVAFWHRAKDTSWEGTRPMALLANGRRITGRDVELWQRLWYGKLCRPSCYACGFHSTNRPGDITIGDYWGLDGAHPGLAFGNGTSCLIVNDGQGAKLVSVCGNKLQLVPSEISLCANEKQPMLLRPPVPDENKGAFWESYYESGLEMAAKAVCAIERPSALEIAKRTARHILKPLFAKKTITTERKDSEVDDGKAWKVAEVAEDGQHDKSEYPLVYAAKNTSDKIREKSSSGGMFHALASAVIGLGGVVYGCAFDEKLSAVHIRCETIEEAERCMGSKYSQSRMGDTIKNVKEDLECGKLVLFTGTPCEVAAVRKVCGNVGGGCL